MKNCNFLQLKFRITKKVKKIENKEDTKDENDGQGSEEEYVEEVDTQRKTELDFYFENNEQMVLQISFLVQRF